LETGEKEGRRGYLSEQM
jgi:hypothetical protein